MDTKELIDIISSIVTPGLIGVVIFFLKNLYARFSDLEKDVKQMLIKGAGLEQRIEALEEDIKELRQQFYEWLKG